MRIGIFIDDYQQKTVNGVVTSTRNYKRALEELGHEVWLVAPTAKDEIDDEPHVIRLKSFPTPPMKLLEKRRGAITYPGFEKKFDEYHFDVVHTMTEFLVGMLGHNVAKRQGIPHIDTFHTLYAEMFQAFPVDVFLTTLLNSFVTPLSFRKKPINVLKKELFDTATRADLIKEKNWQISNIFLNETSFVVVPSRHLRAKLVARGLTTPSAVLPNGLFTEFYRENHGTKLPFRRQKNDFWVATVGRISGEKRQEILVDALSDLPANVKAVIVGDGPAMDDLRDRVRAKNLGARVILAGAKERAAVADILQNVDAFAMTSYHFDNQPMVILEAIASGLPVVYCDSDLREGLAPAKFSANGELRNAARANALLTDGIDGEAFAKALKKLAAEKSLRETLSQNSRKLSQNFDSLKLAKKLVKIYQTATPLARKP